MTQTLVGTLEQEEAEMAKIALIYKWAVLYPLGPYKWAFILYLSLGSFSIGKAPFHFLDTPHPTCAMCLKTPLCLVPTLAQYSKALLGHCSDFRPGSQLKLERSLLNLVIFKLRL